MFITLPVGRVILKNMELPGGKTKRIQVFEDKQVSADKSPGWSWLYLQADGRFLRGSMRLCSASQNVRSGASWVAVQQGFRGAATEL